MRLVADVGGTNSRLALCQAGVIVPDTLKTFNNADWDSLYNVIDAYLTGSGQQPLQEMVIAVAGPVHGTHALLTNRNWRIETSQLITTFGCETAHLLNDLTALGHSVPVLTQGQLSTISAGTPKKNDLSQSLVVGIGTGFNVSPVLEHAGHVVCPAAETGHISMPLSLVAELDALSIPRDRFPTVETLFSGRGFTAFCRDITGNKTLDGQAAIASHDKINPCAVTAAVNHYSALLGHLLRDLSLSYMPSSGIYLAGSVARAVARTSALPCIEVLRQPCSIRKAVDFPVWTIEDDSAALSGCAGFSAT